MVTVLILLSIALIICMVFMGIILYMLFTLERNLEMQKMVTNTVILNFNTLRRQMRDVENEGSTMHLLNEESKEMNRKTEVLVQSTSNTLAEAKSASKMALETIQQVRRMLKLDPEGTQRLVCENGKPTEIRTTAPDSMAGFKYEEKEDPEEPRS